MAKIKVRRSKLRRLKPGEESSFNMERARHAHDFMAGIVTRDGLNTEMVTGLADQFKADNPTTTREELRWALNKVAQVLEEGRRERKARAAFCNEIIALMDSFWEKGGKSAETAEDRLQRIYKIAPAILRRFYPRKFVMPEGYVSPQVLAIPAFCGIASAVRCRLADEKGTALWATNDRLEPFCATVVMDRLSVPTYFVGAQMLEALQQTDLPSDFSIRDMPWPMDAIAFMLPLGSIKSSRGDIVAVSVVRIEKGSYMLPNLKFGSAFLDTHATLEPALYDGDEDSRCFVQGITETGHVFQWSCPLDETDVAASSRKDAGMLTGFSSVSEIEFSDQLGTMALQLMLAMGACPKLQERGAQRPSTGRGGRVQAPQPSDKWTPNFFGRTYQPPRCEGVGHGGAGGTRRFHWRRGHWRHQRYGTGNSLVKPKWLEPMPVGVRTETVTTPTTHAPLHL